jgi:hypothetical protein
MVRRAALERTPGLPWLRLDVGDDLALGLLMKSHGARCGIANGQGLLGLHWYRSVGEMAVGFEKNAWSVVGHFTLWRLVLKALGGLALESAPWLAVLPWAPGWLVWLGAAALTSVVLSTVAFRRAAGRPFLPSLLGPLGAAVMAWILVRAGILGKRRGGVLWRGTLYPNELLRGSMRVML